MLIVLGIVAYVVVGCVLALVVFQIDRSDGPEFARTVGHWWTPLLYLGMILLWPPAVLILGVGVLFGLIS
jgi:hypothetical protein